VELVVVGRWGVGCWVGGGGGGGGGGERNVNLPKFRIV
jgi:hypothetical protein